MLSLTRCLDRLCLHQPNIICTSSSLLRQQTLAAEQQHRHVASFFNRYTAKDLWRSATSVSKYGQKKGQRPKIRARDLNKFRRIGEGHMRVAFPGLNAPLFEYQQERAGSLPRAVEFKPKVLPQLPDYWEKFEENRDIIDVAPSRSLKEKVDPLVRGYTGTAYPGRRIGNPVHVDQNGNITSIEGFESICLELKRVGTMKGREGRRLRTSCMVMVGNGQGMAGWAVIKKELPRLAIKAARDAAVKRLCHVELLDQRTIYQNFYAEYNRTFVFAYRMPKGYGVVAHRALKSVCQLIGIKDIYIKLEGASGNVQAMVRAFLAGLNHQETYQQLAERKKLLVVEMSPANQYVPKVLAAPITGPVRTEAHIEDDEELELDDVYGQSRLQKVKPSVHERKRTFWEDNVQRPEVSRKLWQTHPHRNMDAVRRQLLVDNVVPRWTRDFRHQASELQNQQYVNCERPFPIGLGLSDVLRPDEESAEPGADSGW